MTSHVMVEGDRDQKYALSSAILLYRASSRHDDMYATVHAIDRSGKGGARLSPGVPATQEACAEFVRSMAIRGAFSGFLGPHMLYIGPQLVAWWRPPSPARVWFDTTGTPAGDQTKVTIGKQSAVTPHPGLVFALHGGNWYVFAVKGDARPTADSALFQVPYFNVWDSGQICEGNVKRPERATPQTIAAFERAFFESRFTHPNTPRLVKYKGGAGAFWSAMLDGKFKTFPHKHLRSLDTTLGKQIAQMEKSR